MLSREDFAYKDLDPNAAHLVFEFFTATRPLVASAASFPT